jgi:RNA recognition motif-containing protein
MSVEDARKLFVAGLSETATEDDVRQLFEGTGGSVDELSVPRDRATGNIRGFAFLTMATESQARAAREKLDGSVQAGRSISVREFRGDRTTNTLARPPQGPPPGDDSTLYIGNLPFNCTSEELGELFRARGFDDVRRVHLPIDPEGRARGFGFLTLGSAESARRAVDEVHDGVLHGRTLSVSVARARGEKPSPRVGGPPSRQIVSRPPPGGSPPDLREDTFRQPPPPDFGAPADPDARRVGRWEKKKEKKRKVKAPTAEKEPKRRRGGAHHSTRPGDYLEDWDDD